MPGIEYRLGAGNGIASIASTKNLVAQFGKVSRIPGGERREGDERRHCATAISARR
jgi:hypothetical protein